MIAILLFCAYVFGYILVFGLMLATFFCATTAMNWALNSFSYKGEIEEKDYLVFHSGQLWLNGKKVKIKDGIIQDD